MPLNGSFSGGMDTDARSRAVVDQHVWQNMNVRIRTKVWFEVNGEFAIGEGGIALLAGIMKTGSLTRAARSVGWSYRHAWGYIRNAERMLATSLTEPRPGKGSHRGTTLTPVGRMLCERLMNACEIVDKAAEAISDSAL